MALSYTTNYNLAVTNDLTNAFGDWLTAMSATSNSNMTKIDAALANKGSPILFINSVPLTSTVGVVGQVLFDTADHSIYQCTAVVSGVYTWTLKDMLEPPIKSAIETSVDDTDTIPFSDVSNTGKTAKISWLNIKSTLKTYFNGIYAALTHNQADTTITFTDVTSGNASTSNHGYLPKLGGGTTNYLRADGAWATPSGVGGITSIGNTTPTSLTGMLKGNGTDIDVAVAGTDYAAASHTHVMTGYSKPSVTSSILVTDTVNTAIGKLETGVDITLSHLGLQPSMASGGTNIAVDWTTVSTGFLGEVLPLIKSYNCHIKLGAGHSVNMSTYVFTPQDSATYSGVKNCIVKAQALGIVIDMLQLYEQNASSWSSPITITAGQEATYFSHHTAVALTLAGICNTYGIPMLSIGNELTQISGHTYTSYWITMINTIRAQFPNLKLLYSAEWTILDDLLNAQNWYGDCLNNHLDFIGVNAYIQISKGAGVTPAVTIDNVTDFEAKDSWFMRWHRGSTGAPVGYFDDLYRAWKTWQKPVIITETGCVNRSYDLTDPNGNTPQNLASPFDYRASALNVKTTFNVCGYSDWIQGIFLWQVYDYTTTTSGKLWYWLENNLLTPFITDYFGRCYNG